MAASSLLEELGLSRNESKVYMTLLRLGKANSAEIARESGVHRINVYDVLNSLISKGLALYITEGGMRVFSPQNPEKLREAIDAKKMLLEKELPGLLMQYSLKREPWEVGILRGAEGKKTQFEETLRTARNTEHRVFIPHGLISLSKTPYNTMLRTWYERLAKQNVRSRSLILDTPDARERASLFRGLEKFVIRFSKGMNFSPVSWDVCQDLLFLTFHTEPYLIIRIKSKDIARAFAGSFDLMWKNATK